MMKKILSYLIWSVLLIGVVSCGNSKPTHVKDLENIKVVELSKLQRLLLLDTINNLAGLSLMDSTILIYPEYKHIEQYNYHLNDSVPSGFLVKTVSGKEQLYSYEGKSLVEGTYDDIRTLASGLLVAKNTIKKAFKLELSNGNEREDSVDVDYYTLYDFNGKKLLEGYNKIYERSAILYIEKHKVAEISSGTYEDLREETLGVISRTGEILVPCEYEEIKKAGGQYNKVLAYEVCKKGDDINRRGLFVGNKQVVPCEYYEIKTNSDNTGAVLVKSYDKRGREIAMYVTELPEINPTLIYSGRATYCNGGDAHADYVYCQIYTPGDAFRSKRFGYNGEEILD